jgi:hypothetical protein
MQPRRQPVVRHACPRCQGPTHRIPRRLVDQLIDRFWPHYRFRCLTAGCCWVGNIRVGAAERLLPGHGGYRKRHVLASPRLGGWPPPGAGSP